MPRYRIIQNGDVVARADTLQGILRASCKHSRHDQPQHIQEKGLIFWRTITKEAEL